MGKSVMVYGTSLCQYNIALDKDQATWLQWMLTDSLNKDEDYWNPSIRDFAAKLLEGLDRLDG